MIITPSAVHSGFRNAGSLEHLNTGTGNACIRIYDDSAQPVLLVEIQLDKPCGSIVGNKLVLTSSTTAMIMKTGNAKMAEVITASGDSAFICDVGDVNSTSVVKLPSTTLLLGGKVAVTSAVIG